MRPAAQKVLAWGTVRYASFPDRVAAAATAGFGAIGLAIPYYLSLLEQGWTDAQLRTVLLDYGVSVGEAEVIYGFAAAPGAAGVPERPGLVYADPAAEAAVFRMADEFGVPVAQAVGTFDDRPVDDRTSEAFAALCDRAVLHGLTIALEFVPYTNIPDVAAAAAIVAEADRSNGGLCVDSWHFSRGNPDWTVLASIPSRMFAMVQVNDGPIRPETENIRLEAITRRRCLGDGEFELRRFLEIVRADGDARPISVEVYSDDLNRLTSAEAATLVSRSVDNY